MRSKIKSAKGFTLAELLIVVAIIGVLVAIAIPIFTGQLERSREAVDLSDVRSAYAEVMMAVITGDTTAKYTKDDKQTIWNNGNYSITVAPLKQQKDGWQTPLPIIIGGVSSGAGEPQWVGNPGTKGSCVITYHPAEGSSSEYVSFVWSGGTSGDNGNNEPGETPGTDPSTPGENLNTWPQRPASDDSKGYNITVKKGQVVFYEDAYYICVTDTYTALFNQWRYETPDLLDTYKSFCKIGTKKHYPSEIDYEHYSTPCVVDLGRGDLFYADNGAVYVYPGGGTCPYQTAPTIDPSQWVLVKSGSPQIW